MKTRMERLNVIHKKIRSENEEFLNKINSLSRVPNLKVRLLNINPNAEIIQDINNYLSNNRLEKPAVSKNKNKELLPKNFIYDLKKISSELKNLGENKKIVNEQNFADLFTSNLHEKNRLDLIKGENQFVRDLELLEIKYNAQNPFDYHEKFNSKIITQALNTHTIPYKQMNSEVEKKNREKIVQTRKHWKEAKEKGKHTLKGWYFAFPLFLLIVSVVLLLVFLFI